MKNIKRILSVVISLTLLLSSIYVGGIISVSAETVEIWDGTETAPTIGSGTKADPFIVTNAKELAYATTYYNNTLTYFMLANDIYVNDVTSDNWYQASGLKNWVDENNGTFYAHLDGNGYTVYGIFYSGTDYCGLVPRMDGGTIKNIGVKNSYISALESGGIVGYKKWSPSGVVSTIENCYSSSDVTLIGTNVAGGIVGRSSAEGLTINNCYSLANLEAQRVGGIIANQWASTVMVTNCFTNTAFNGREQGNYLTCANVYQGVDGPITVKNVSTLAQMQGTDATTNMSALDFEHTFKTTDTYPALRVFTDESKAWNGAEKEPYTDKDADEYIDIAYPSELAWVIANNGNSGGKYELLNDIYLNDIKVDAESGTYTNNGNTEPLEWYSKADGTFKGTLYGNGYIVYGLFYDNASETTLTAGLVPSANTLTISGVGVENSYIVQNTAYRVGAVIGTVHSATKVEISNCFVGEKVYIKGTSVGGICGGGAPTNTQDSVIISNCYSHAKLSGTTHTGGIFGNIWSTGKRFNITDCYVIGDKIYSGSIGASNLSAWADNYATVSQNGGAASTVLSSNDMKGITAETSMSGLDFDDTYVITDSYPHLRIFYKGLQSGENLLSAVKLSGASLRIADINGKTVDNSSAGLRFYASVDTTAGKYRPATDENVEYGILFETKERLGGAELTIDTVNCARVKADALIGEGEILSYSAEILYLSKENLDADFVVRGYMINGYEITYTEPQDYCAAVIADKVYEDSEDEGVKERIDIIFAESERFLGSDAEILTFSLFSDFHYKEGMYLTSIADMQSILDNANANNVDFIIHGGDFCNDYSGSPELMNTYLNNNHGLSAYGIYGNHELESSGNSMGIVTPLLTNRADNVIWGTDDGKIGDGSVGYYYFDNGDFRIVCTDTNYSYNPETEEWEHYPTNSYGAPSGNTYAHSMGPVQLKWLETVLTDAAQSGKQCIVMGHATFNTAWSGYSPDAEAVVSIYNKVNNIKKGTVIMSLNGHYHTNRMMVADNVLFFDVNTTRNGYWKNGATEHYTDEQTFQYVKYDTDGNVVSTTTESLTTLSQSANTWFFENPLSAIVKISTTGKITIDGVQSDWIYDVTPGDVPEYVTPEISDNTFNLWY